MASPATRSSSVHDLRAADEMNLPGGTVRGSGVLSADMRMTESWSPKMNSMSALMPPDPDFLALKRRLKRSRDNIRQSRTDFFSSHSPVGSSTPTPNEMHWLRRDRNSDTLWENQLPMEHPHPIDRLSVPSICVTNNSGSPLSISDREDELDGASTSSQSLRYFSEDEGVELRRPSSSALYAVPVARSQSFQEAATFASGSPSPENPHQFSGKRVVSEDVLTQKQQALPSRTCPAPHYLPHRPLRECSDHHPHDANDTLHVKSHVVTRLIAKMRRATLDWRRANKSRRGELTSFVYFINLSSLAARLIV